MNLDRLLGACVALGWAGFFAFAAFLLVVEAILVLTKRKPITAYVRDVSKEHPQWTLVITLCLGVLLGHLLWH